MVRSLNAFVRPCNLRRAVTYTRPMTTPRSPTATPLGLRMRRTRIARGLSMRALAEAASTRDATMSHAAISLLESGRQATLAAVTAVRLARVLGVTVEWLVDGPA